MQFTERASTYRVIAWLCLGGLSLFWLTGTAQGEAANPMRAPKVLLRSPSRPTPQVPTSLPVTVFDHMLRFFQRVISPTDGPRSNMYPTGSAYARQVFKKHGALLGIMLTAERLLHEGNEWKVAPRIRKYGLWRTYDPVEANDWWWHGPAWIYQPGEGRSHRR
jgi:hypothetical protein